MPKNPRQTRKLASFLCMHISVIPFRSLFDTADPPINPLDPPSVRVLKGETRGSEAISITGVRGSEGLQRQT